MKKTIIAYTIIFCLGLFIIILDMFSHEPVEIRDFTYYTGLLAFQENYSDNVIDMTFISDKFKGQINPYDLIPVKTSMKYKTINQIKSYNIKY